jgi:hypothetical protein
VDPQLVGKLECEIENAVAEVIMRLGRKRLPLLPSRPTMHRMAKAAFTVYEEAVESSGSDFERF